MAVTRLAQRGLTGRAVALGAVVVFLAIILASPVHRYVSARAAVSQAAQQRAASEEQLAQLRQEAANLNDPNYIEKLARTRLQFAMPGDTVYVVTTPGQQSPIDEVTAPAAPLKAPGATWSQRLWGSVQAADGSTP
ncbi:cell division protein FtsL [Frankineae bacterium MT45]|nr:cell division protein FtsL [Frankineae bacterium MT45]